MQKHTTFANCNPRTLLRATHKEQEKEDKDEMMARGQTRALPRAGMVLHCLHLAPSPKDILREIPDGAGFVLHRFCFSASVRSTQPPAAGLAPLPPGLVSVE